MEPLGTPARGRVPAAPVRPGPAAWTPTGRPGSGHGRLGRQARGQVRCWAGGSLLPREGLRRARARLARRAGEPPPPGPVGIAGGSRGREEGGGVGSVRPICLGPEGSPSTCSPGQPPARAGVPGVTAASARQLLLPALLPTPGAREVRPRLPHRASAPRRLLPCREHWSGPGPRQGGAMIWTWDGGWESRARGGFGT